MPKSRFGQNTVVDAKATFSNPDDTSSPVDARTGFTLLDPSVVVCHLRAPNGTVTTYIYGTDAELTRDSQGKYRLRFTLAAIGTYRWSWASTAGTAAVTTFDSCDSYSIDNL